VILRLLPPLVVLLALLAPTAEAQVADDPSLPLVYVFSLDGMDGDRVDQGKAPFLKRLIDGQEGARAAYYRESRSIMVAETNPNHTAMATGAYGDKSGIPGNAFAVYSDDAKRNCDADTTTSTDPPGFEGDGGDESRGDALSVDGEEAACLLAETMFAAVKRQPGADRITTSGIFGKPKLARLFETKRIDPNAFDADDLWTPCEADGTGPEYCERVPVNPANGYALSDADVMAEVIQTVNEGVRADGAVKRPNLTFVNFPTIDGAGHASGTESGAYDQAIALMDTELQRFVANQKARGLWERTIMFVVSDHSMDTTLSSRPSLRQAFTLGGIPPNQVVVVQNGSVDMVYLADRQRPDRDAFLKRLRELSLQAANVDEALYRLPNAADGGAANTLDTVHPAWNIAGPRTGDLLVTQLEGGAFNEPNPLVGNHGSPRTTDNTFAVISGGTQVRPQAIGGIVGARFDDTLLNPGSAENVDVAPTVLALLGRTPPAQSEGRVLTEAFDPGAFIKPSDGVSVNPPPLVPVRRLIQRAKLMRPVFGRRSGPVRLSLRVARRARVTVQLRRGGRVVKRVRLRNVRADRTYRLRISARGVRRGRYVVRVVAVAGKKDRQAVRLRIRRR
jgi:predicted AlkP superfamily pyrophosphatase or phosphodiesterase